MDIQDVINYINETPNNTNPAVLKGMVEAIVESSESGGGGGGGSSLPTVTFTVTGMDSDGNPIFECDKTYQEAYRMCVDGNSCAKMVVPNETDLYTTLVLIAGFGIRYAFHSYDTALALEFMDIYYFPDGEITFEHSHYDKVTDDTPVS